MFINKKFFQNPACLLIALIVTACGGGGGGGGGDDGAVPPPPVLSTNANLSALTISVASFTEAFDPDTSEYFASTSLSVGSTTVTATAAENNVSSIAVNGRAVSSGADSDPITLVDGQNVLTVVVTAEDGATQKTYTIRLTALSDDADLSSITFSTLTLNESFDAELTDYTADVSFDLDNTTVTFVTSNSDVGAAQLNGNLAPESTESNPINLAVGENTVTIEVTAVDGITSKTYSVVITRADLVNNHTPELVVFRADKETDELFELYSVLDDGSADPVKLSESLAAGSEVHDFAISNSRTLVAFIANQTDLDRHDLFIAPIDGSTPAIFVTQLLSPHSFKVKSVAWSPDSSTIIFLADIDTENTDELYMVNADGTDFHKINGSTSGVVEIGDYAWSPDGNFVAYKVYNLNQPSQVIGLNSHVVGTVSGQTGYSVRLNPTLVSGGSVKDFAWSSNSTSVAYRADQETLSENELFIGTANVSQVSTKGSHDLDPGFSVTDYAWAPDGTYLAYLAGGDPNNALYTTTADTNVIGQLVSHTVEGDIQRFTWSPDSTQIAYLADTEFNFELFVSAADGSSTGEVFSATMIESDNRRSGGVVSYRWSPDGSYLAYLADQDTVGTYELYINTSDAGSIGQKISGTLIEFGDVWDFSWSPDSSKLAYRATENSLGTIALHVSHIDQSVVARQVSSLSVIDHADAGVFKYQWSSDSEALSYRATQSSAGVMELYSSLANGHIRGTNLSSSLVSGGNVPVANSIEELFTDGSWLPSPKRPELCGLDYDAINDALFITKCIFVDQRIEILRYSLATHTVKQVYQYQGSFDVGLRVFDDELFVAKTYGNSILRLNNLDKPWLNEVADYFGDQSLDEMNEVNDITLVDGDIYMVHGNFHGGEQHDGIQKLTAPGFDMLSDFISEAAAGWDVGTGRRSIVSAGSGDNAEYYIATGSSAGLEHRDFEGNLLNFVANQGQVYLQKDSANRIYTINAFSTSAYVRRWSSDLSVQEDFNYVSNSNRGLNTRFAIKEDNGTLRFFAAPYRSTNPRFEEIILIE